MKMQAKLLIFDDATKMQAKYATYDHGYDDRIMMVKMHFDAKPKAVSTICYTKNCKYKTGSGILS